uniref:Uncharacterized protein n=1 Tax=Rhizophora mucronata TaxID=61149 RepID=A0A2P2NSR7_RHIMU
MVNLMFQMRLHSQG